MYFYLIFIKALFDYFVKIIEVKWIVKIFWLSIINIIIKN